MTTPRATALGATVRAVRGKNGWSVESASERAGIGHMTWRRIEDGYPVRAKSYAALDLLFEQSAGTFGAAARDGVSEALARSLGVVQPATDDDAEEAYIRRLIAEAPGLTPEAAALVVRSFAPAARIDLVTQEATTTDEVALPDEAAHADVRVAGPSRGDDEQARAIGYAVLAIVRALS